MTKTLTEQWREGKLPNGDYYIKVRGSLSKKDFFAHDNCINGKWAYTLDGNLIDIIEKVPSYNKYNELVQKIHILEDKSREAKNALNLIEVHTGAIGQSEEDMNESLIAIMNICRAYFGEE